MGLDPFSFHRHHFSEQGLGAFGAVAAQMALAALGAHDLARPGGAEAL